MCPSSFARRHRVLLLAMVFGFSALGCHRLLPSEKKIIGTWEFTGIDVTARVVFRRDHVVVNLAAENESADARWTPVACGRWRLQGNEIVTEEQVLPIPGHQFANRITRIPISEFRADALVRADGRSPFIRVSIAGERYAQLLALLALFVSLAVLAACIYLIWARFVRKAAVFLAIAAALALVWAVLLLTTELTQTGAVILSMTSLRLLQSAREVIGIASIVMFAIGCFALLALGRRETSN